MRFMIVNGRRVWYTVTREGTAAPHFVKNGNQIKTIKH
jgi:hypothetical protein